jgi:ribosome biogenesis GTPase
VDQVVPVFAAANPAPRWNLLDRYLVTAESLELPSLICITKLDLVKEPGGSIDEEIMQQIAEYRKIGYPVVLVSAHTGEGMDELKDSLSKRTSVFLGKSGVGKTSLLNALQPGLGLRVNEISQATGKGKHTTTNMEMFPLEIGGAIVDTPGVREFGLWEVDAEDLALFFPEMRPFVGRCRFGMDCQHNEEPGCAVRKAVMAGQVSPRRYQSYMRMKDE